MKKCLFYLPAVLFTAAVTFLTYWLRDFLTLWYAWAALLWLSGFLLSSGKVWGCLPGLIPAAHILYICTQYTGQTMEDRPLGIALAVWMLVCGFFVWKQSRQKADPQ